MTHSTCLIARPITAPYLTGELNSRILLARVIFLNNDVSVISVIGSSRSEISTIANYISHDFKLATHFLTVLGEIIYLQREIH